MNEKLSAASQGGYVSTREAALLLNVSVGTVLNMVERGRLKAWRTEGGHRRIERESIQQLLAQRHIKVANPAGTGTPLRVLVVEDDPQAREVYQLQFDSWGLPVKLRLATGGVDGLVEIGREMPDLLLLDLMMPDIDGFAVLRRVYQMPQHQSMDIIVISSMDPTTVAGGLPPGVLFWPKPLQFAQLRGFVEGRMAARSRPD